MRRMVKRPTRCPARRTLLTWLSREDTGLGAEPRLMQHLAQCAWCRQEVEAIQAVLERDLVAEVAAAYWDVEALSTPAARREGAERP